MLRLLLLCSLLLLGLLPAQDVQPAPPDPTLRQFTVPLRDGSLQLSELLQGLLTAYELDGKDLDLPDARIDLTGARGTLLLYSSRKLLLDTVRFRRDSGRQQLLVSIDRARAREVRRQLRARLARFAGRLAGEEVAGRDYALALPEDLDAGRPLVVLVHGVESDAEEFTDLQAFLGSPPRCCQTATFAYPNDESIDRVAAELAARLRRLGGQPVAIVGHSMGGLVARELVEDPALDPGNVRALVLVGTPNAGSNLAGFRLALEARDVLRQADGDGDFARELLDAVIDHWRDGLGEAGGDLFPGSVFLTRLAARARNPKVDYHLVLGTRSLLRPGQLAAVQQEVRQRLGDRKLAQLLRPRLQGWLADLDEIVDGKGDGAVSVARGRLDGTEPVLLPLDHVGLIRLRGLLGHTGQPEDHPVFARIAEWLDPAPAAWLQGRVVDVLGEPVPAAAVWIARERHGAVLRRAMTDGEGVFQLRLPPGGERVVVHAEAAGKSMAPLSNEGACVLLLTMADAVALVGVVRGDDGAPIAGAEVAAAMALATTDAGGRFAFAAVPVGEVVVRAWSAGRETMKTIRAAADTDIELLLAGEPLRPRLLVAPDLPAEVRQRAFFSVTGRPPAGQRLALRADGTALLPVLPFAHEVTLTVPGFAVLPVLCRCAAGARDDLEFRVEPLPASSSTRVHGRVLDTAGNGLAGLCVVGVDRQGARVGITTSAADGAFAMRLPLAADAHCGFGVHLGERPLGGRGDGSGWFWTETTASAVAPIELRLQTCGVIAGVAADRNGVPLAFAEVALSRAASNRRGVSFHGVASCTTDRRGRLLLRGLSDGDYRVTVRGLDGTVGRTDLEVKVGATTPLGALQWLPTGAIEGRLLDAAGRPAANVELRFLPQQGDRYWGIARTDREGRFCVRGLLPGQYRQSAVGGQFADGTVEVQAGVTTRLLPPPGREPRP